MSTPTFVKPIYLSLKTHPEFTEKWVQKRIEEDPRLLGLGEVYVKDVERTQPGAGRLDLLLQDPETLRRYEVELQLGRTDEAHIIRTIEYWDIERKRYPQYDHCAVLVAEDITSRFLNVIGLFNGTMPLIAVQMRAIQIGDTISLVFTKVVDERPLGLDEEDEQDSTTETDRAYWESTRGAKAMLSLADALLEDVRTVAPGYQLKFNKAYIGLAKNDTADNFVVFRPTRESLVAEFRIPRSDELDSTLASSGIDTMPYKQRSQRYRLRVTQSDLDGNRELIRKLIGLAHEYRIQ